jgi:hypothetical protein
MHERYSVKVREHIVEIFGELTIEEAFDFLNFFEKKGYNSVIIGDENSTLILRKRDEEEKEDSICENYEGMYEKFYNTEVQKNEILKEKIRELEILIKKLIIHRDETKTWEEVAKLKNNPPDIMPDPTNYPPENESESDQHYELGKLLIKAIKENFGKCAKKIESFEPSVETPIPFKNEISIEDYKALKQAYINTI